MIVTKLRSAAARLNALAHGFSGSLPIGSRIHGGVSIGAGFYASGPVWLEAIREYEGTDYSSAIEIGMNVRSSPRLHISAASRVEIGDWVLFGENVFLSDHLSIWSLEGH